MKLRLFFNNGATAKMPKSILDFWNSPRTPTYSECTNSKDSTTSPGPSFDIVQPCQVPTNRHSDSCRVPDHISKPGYATNGFVGPCRAQFDLKSTARLEGMRRACKLARQTLDYLSNEVKPGATTEYLDTLAFDFIVKNNAYPSPLMYRKYPKSICTSVNNVACHGIPDSRALKDGDIVNVDVTVYLGGYHGDCSSTFPVGVVDEAASKLMDVTRFAMREAIKICRNGQKLALIGETIEAIVEKHGFSVVGTFCGHGIGQDFHMKPDIIHWANTDDSIMETGMIFTIEPVVSEGADEVRVLEDGWTAISIDDSRSAQFEETILIHDTAAEVLTVA